MTSKRLPPFALLVGLAPLLVACESTGRHLSSWGEITLAPGDTGSCESNPCRVFLELPPGPKPYSVTVGHVNAGKYPAGRTVSIGSLFESKAIRLEGTELPPAYVYIPNVR